MVLLAVATSLAQGRKVSICDLKEGIQNNAPRRWRPFMTVKGKVQFQLTSRVLHEHVEDLKGDLNDVSMTARPRTEEKLTTRRQGTHRIRQEVRQKQVDLDK